MSTQPQPAPEPKPIWQLLKERHADGRSRLLFEFRNGTGFDSNRSADAVAVNFYRTDGFSLIGYPLGAGAGVDYNCSKVDDSTMTTVNEIASGEVELTVRLSKDQAESLKAAAEGLNVPLGECFYNGVVRGIDNCWFSS